MSDTPRDANPTDSSKDRDKVKSLVSRSSSDSLDDEDSDPDNPPILTKRERFEAICEAKNPIFIGKTINGQTFCFGEDFWHVNSFVTERITKWDDDLYEVTSVHKVQAIRGPLAETTLNHGYAKMRWQLPDYITNDLNEQPRPLEEPEDSEGRKEAGVIRRLELLGCNCTPKLLAYGASKQTEDDCVPGGYLTFMVTNAIAGKPVCEVWPRTTQLHFEIHDSLKRGVKELLDHGVVHGDPKSDNILWNEEERRCYIIDFEWACEADERDVWDEVKIDKRLPKLWGLTNGHGYYGDFV